MDQHDQLEQKCKAAFNNFEVEPPAPVWDAVNRELHTPRRQFSIWEYLDPTAFFSNRRARLTGVFTTAIVILFFVTVYFLSLDRHVINGHAYTGDRRLISGTAILFTVQDKCKPWDSVQFYRTVPVDANGYFYFKGVDDGNYLLRIEPGYQPENTDQFIASWYDMHGDPAQSHVIVIDDEDVRTDVHLIRKDHLQTGP
ncbi:MAG: carboxypeptidase regulatory-like domain-containing protein [Alphaproteobacteria bacterium]|nr:carboxypeptidase regulatory-like domain-containing protein [Alphaproteobacteria bacterium]